MRRPGPRIALALAGLLAAACGDNIREPRPDDPLIAAVDTAAPETVRAGEAIDVSCRFFDAAGAEIFPDPVPPRRLRFAPSDAVARDEDGDRIAIRAGDLETSCIIPELALFDESPALTRIDPGPVARLATTVDRDLIVAGDTATARCEAFDAFGNPVDDVEPTLRATPERPGNAIEGLTATLTGAGLYQLSCDLPAVETAGAAVEVLPGLPASLLVTPLPDRPVYSRGEIIELASVVRDRYDNPIPDAEVAVTSTPAAGVADGARFRYFADGLYELSATVAGPIDPAAAAALSASATVLVDGAGPEIACDQPGDGAILDHSPGAPVSFSGQVADLAGVTEVAVNGTPVALDGAGRFAVSLPTDFGINFVDLSAVDEFGRESTRVCSFLVANRFAAEDGDQSGAVSMNLRPAAIDDGSRSGALGSLADMLHVVINSDGLEAAIHQLLLAANPLKDSCDQTVFGVCVFRSRIDYLSSDFAGPNTVELTPVSGGIRGALQLQDAALRLRIRATGGVDSTGWVTVESAQIQMTFDTTLSGGRPRITIRPGSVSTAVGSIDTDFDGVDGFIIDIIAGFAEDRIRDLMEDQISSLIRSRLGLALDDVMANLDISSLGATFEVPRIDGGPPIEMSFTPGFSHVRSNSARLQFGLSTRFVAPAAHVRHSLGTPVANPPGPINPSNPGAAAIAIHSAVLGQAVHALWRAGLFDATLSGGASFPDGASAVLRTGLPPVVTMAGGNRMDLTLGDVAVTLTYPGVFPEPIEMILGVRASLRFSLAGEDITFDDLAVEELYFTSLTTSIDPASRDVIEEFLADVLGGLIVDSLNDALPALPVPSFELPASLAEFGLPAGAVLGLASPTLSAAAPQLVLAGGFAIQ